MNIRRTCVCLLAAASWAFGWPASDAFAHGALVLSQDVCLLKVGPDYMYFSGCRSATPRKRFCEDVPETGETIFSMENIFRLCVFGAGLSHLKRPFLPLPGRAASSARRASRLR